MATLEREPTRKETERVYPVPGPRIALVTPYTGGNLGDAAIQDSMISNLRQRIPSAQFLGITLNCENFLRQHGERAFPLLASTRPLETGFARGAARATDQEDSGGAPNPRRPGGARALLRPLKRIPGLAPLLRKARTGIRTLRQEIHHWLAGYRVLRTQDLLLLSGGGQLDDEYGGPWIFPYTYFKWMLLARLAGVPCGMASVGAGSLRPIASRFFIGAALRLSRYRSFREPHSKRIAASLFAGVNGDPVVPDLALQLPESELPTAEGGIRTLAHGRPVVVVSPIAYGKPVNWPKPDQLLYQRYVQQMSALLTGLLARNFLVVVACSSLGDDESVIPDILKSLDDASRRDAMDRIHFPKIATWRDLVSALRGVDYLIASRLHGILLGFVAGTPAIAISFDPKVDWAMEDLQQTSYLCHIRDFTANEILDTLDKLKNEREAAVEKIAAYRKNVLSGPESAQQYDRLAGLALAHHRSQPGRQAS
jgi:polysaccharide pyruvyl transferase WcaK-like protein